jgi:hypothetical protein
MTFVVQFVSTPVGMFTVGDSILCVVQDVDEVKERVVVTFKPSVVNSSSVAYLRLCHASVFYSMTS